jgi:hypothetical protein
MQKILLASAAAATVLSGLGAGGTAFAQSGSYQQSCRNARSSNGTLTAECAGTDGRYHSTTLAYGQCRGDIANRNGTLSCNGAAGVQQGGGQGYGQQNDGGQGRRDNSGQVAAGVVAGAILGGLLADGDRAPPPPPPPPYGDHGYGDRGYGDHGYGDRDRPDARYAQGGWGYGHQQGEWVPIRDRADWFEKRIGRAQSMGRLTPRQARDLRRQLFAIEDVEDDYVRDGHMGMRERFDLDQRFNDLSMRIRFDEDRF